MGTMTKQLKSMLTEFFVNEIKSDALNGVTYAILLDSKDARITTRVEKYKAICNEAKRSGYGNNELFRGFKVSNGYIFDMDLGLAKQILTSIIQAVNVTNGTESADWKEIVQTSPDKYRKSDMMSLAKYIKSEYDEGRDLVEVALFNRNSNPKIMMSVRDNNNNLVTIKYNAYAIRPWDIEVINEKLLMPAGIRIAKVESCEILPSGNGVSFILHLERCYS